MKKKILLTITVGAVLLLGGILSWQNFYPEAKLLKKAEADSTDNVTGWAWSDNIGWVSFNCYNDFNGNGVMGDVMSDQCTGKNYGVNIDASGNLSGYAWSDNIGWITFNIGDTDCPDGSNCAPKVSLSGTNTGDVSGWAFACHASDPNDPNVCNPAIAPSDDYGWIKLRDDSNAFSGDDLYIDTTDGHFHNYAYGGGPNDEAVIGWISFNCETGGPGELNICSSYNYYVWTDSGIFNTPPSMENTNIQSPTNEQFCDNDASYVLSWDFIDPDEGDYEDTVSIKINTKTYTIDYSEDDGIINGSSQSFSFDVGPDEVLGDELSSVRLQYGETYNFIIKVQDSRGAWSDNWEPTINVEEDYPECGFIIDPTKPNISEEIQFTDTSSSTPGITNWSWNFGNGDTSSLQNPTYTYYEVGDKTITLTITDVVGTCSCSKPLKVRPGSPDYIEVIPR